MATSDLEIEGQGHKTIAFVALPIYTHIPNLKVLTKIFFKLSRPKGNLCGGGGVTVLNPKYPRLSSGDTINSSADMSPQIGQDRILKVEVTRQVQRLNQGHTMTLHTYIPPTSGHKV